MTTRDRTCPLSCVNQGIVGRVNAYHSYNAAIDAAADAAEAEKAEQQALSFAARAADNDNDDNSRFADGSTLRFPPIGRVAVAGERPRSATRPITPETLRNFEGWYL